jgi:hypothetical protein
MPNYSKYYNKLVMAKFGFVLQIGDISHKRIWVRRKLAKFGYRLFRDTSRILFFLKYSTIFWHGIFWGCQVAKMSPKRKEKQRKTNSHFDWPYWACPK